MTPGIDIARRERPAGRGGRPGRGGSRGRAGERGQATVELVAIVPVVFLLGAVAWQLALAGHTAWLAASAARTAARADTVGRNVTKAARSALPRSLERDLEVERVRQGAIRVSVKVPLLLRHWRTPLRVAAVSSLGGPE